MIVFKGRSFTIAYGEGTFLAIGYGKLAAQELRESFAKNDFSFATCRDRIHKSRMGRSLRLRYHTAKTTYGTRSMAVHRVLWSKWAGCLTLWSLEALMRNWA